MTVEELCKETKKLMDAGMGNLEVVKEFGNEYVAIDDLKMFEVNYYADKFSYGKAIVIS